MKTLLAKTLLWFLGTAVLTMAAIMGAAALSLVYVATGRMDAYVEYGLRLWDIAAGGLIVECAGGDFWNEPLEGDYRYQILASNGRLKRKLQSCWK